MERKNLNRWEEQEFLADWVKHAPTGSLDKSVDDILAELGMVNSAQPAQPAQPVKPAQPAQPVKPAQPTQPVKPAQPAQPVKPAQPAQPVKPAQPAQPVKPAQPTQPVKPAQPAQPVKPAQPTQPVKPAQPTQPVKPAQKPLTAYPRPVKPTAPATSPVPAVAPSAKSKDTPAAETAQSVVASPKASSAPRKKKKKKKDKWIWRFLGGILPKKGDGALELIRKGVCMVAILVLAGSSCVLLNDFVLVPAGGKQIHSSTLSLKNAPPPEDSGDSSHYPKDILDEFKNLYDANDDTIGWIRFPSTYAYWSEELGGEGYVVVQSEDNDYYLHRDFKKGDDRNGTIFMDYRCNYKSKEAAEECPITILYGHNMYSGQMFASVNKILDHVDIAKSAPIVEFDSCYGKGKYKVFGIISDDTSEENAYNFLQTQFNTDEEFQEYIRQIKNRSWYDYTGMDSIKRSDKILVLYTCSNTYQTTMGKEGRTILFARKIRPGEDETVDSSTISVNEDKQMPLQWYRNNELEVPADHYSNNTAE